MILKILCLGFRIRLLFAIWLPILILSSFQLYHYAYSLMVDILEHVLQRLLQSVKFLCQEQVALVELEFELCDRLCLFLAHDLDLVLDITQGDYLILHCIEQGPPLLLLEVDLEDCGVEV